MDNPVAFNVESLSGGPTAVCRVYLAPERIYFLWIGSLGAVTSAGRSHGTGGVSWLQFLMAAFISGFAIFFPSRPSVASGKEALYEAEKQPLEDRYHANPDNFAIEPAAFPDSAIEPLASAWKKTSGQWVFTLPERGKMRLAFVTRMDMLVAKNHLPRILGTRLQVRI